jgi:hypothetical protein
VDPEKASAPEQTAAEQTAAEQIEPAAGDATLPGAPDPASTAGPAGGDVPPMRVTRPDRGGPEDRRPEDDEKQR